MEYTNDYKITIRLGENNDLEVLESRALEIIKCKVTAELNHRARVAEFKNKAELEAMGFSLNGKPDYAGTRLLLEQNRILTDLITKHGIEVAK